MRTTLNEIQYKEDKNQDKQDKQDKQYNINKDNIQINIEVKPKKKYVKKTK